MKKADFAVIAAVVLLAAVFFGVNARNGSRAVAGDAKVIVMSEGKLYGQYRLDTDQTIKLSTEGHYNQIRIEDGKVWMEEADCHDQICVDTREAVRPGESIVCLPNRVIVRVEGSGEQEVDSIAQ